MKEHKVVMAQDHQKPVAPSSIEKEINRYVKDGWNFVQIAAAAESESEATYSNWVYIVFVREI